MGRTCDERLAEALAQLTAISEVLRVISASPTDSQPVLEAVAQRAAHLCQAPLARMLIVDDNVLHVMAHYSVEGESPGPAFPTPLRRTSITGRAVLNRETVHHADILPLLDSEFPDARQNQQVAGFRAVLAVPLMRDGVAYGAIFLWRRAPGLFSSDQVALVETFAQQVAIAIDNVRLFKETKEALEQQTATSEILRAISRSPHDVQPVFETIAAAALKLCRASSGLVFTFDGELIHLAADANLDPQASNAWRNFFPRPPSHDTAVTRAVLTRNIVAIPDTLHDPEYLIGPTAAATGFRSALAVPLMRQEKPIGVVGLGRTEPGPFPDKQVALLQTFADQAVIAIETVRLFKELDARTAELTQSVEELRALGEVGQAVSSTLDLETVLRTIVSRATALAGMDGGAIYEYDETREEFHLHATDKLPDELMEALRATPIRKGEGALGRMAASGEAVQARDIMDEGTYFSHVREILIRLGYRSLLALPLLRENHLLGGLVVNRKKAGEFAPQVIDLLKTFATQSALAIQNARLFREIEEKSRLLETASRHKSEFLANMSHELRTPLNAINGFSEALLERLFGELNPKQEDYLQDIHSSGRHLLSLINDILDLSKIEAGRMELMPSNFNPALALSNAMTLVRERAQQHGIALELQVDPALGEITADERKFKQIVVNLLSNAVKFTPDGGRIDVSARREQDHAVIAVRDTGIGIAEQDQAAAFEEFRQVGRDYTNKHEGTGLGLALTRKFIELHGGRIWLDSVPRRGSTFTFTIPLSQ